MEESPLWVTQLVGVSSITKISSAVSLKAKLMSVRNEYFLEIHWLEIIQALKAIKNGCSQVEQWIKGPQFQFLTFNTINFGAIHVSVKTTG